MTQFPDYVSTEDIAARYDVSPETVRRWCRDGAIPGAIQLGRQWRIPRKWMTEPLSLSSGTTQWPQVKRADEEQ